MQRYKNIRENQAKKHLFCVDFAYFCPRKPGRVSVGIFLTYARLPDAKNPPYPLILQK